MQFLRNGGGVTEAGDIFDLYAFGRAPDAGPGGADLPRYTRRNIFSVYDVRAKGIAKCPQPTACCLYSYAAASGSV